MISSRVIVTVFDLAGSTVTVTVDKVLGLDVFQGYRFKMISGFGVEHWL